jgi:hypothetical protein
MISANFIVAINQEYLLGRALARDSSRLQHLVVFE